MPCLFFPCHVDRREKCFLDPSLLFGMTNGLLGVEILFQGGVKGQGTARDETPSQGIECVCN